MIRGRNGSGIAACERSRGLSSRPGGHDGREGWAATAPPAERPMPPRKQVGAAQRVGYPARAPNASAMCRHASRCGVERGRCRTTRRTERTTWTPSFGLFAGGGEILRLARPASRSSGFRMRGPSGPAPAAGPDHRLWETAVLFHLRDAFRPATSGWRGRAATATSERRCCRLPPSLMPTAACRLRPVRTTGSPSAGRKPPCRTGPLTLVADLYRRMPAARPGELLAHVSPLGWEHINLTGEYRWPGADPSGTAKRLA